MTEIRFTAAIVPRAKGRPRFARRGRKVFTFTPPETRKWERAFAALAAPYAPRVPFEEPLELVMLVVLKRPAKLRVASAPDGLIPTAARPDLDNLVKSGMDAMAAWWVDDAQVVSLIARKAYAERDGVPRIEVAVRTLLPGTFQCAE